jgi:hypothetical protein
MARDVEADVEINDKSSAGLRSFLAGLRRADRQVKDTQKGIDAASESTGKLGKSVDENAKAFAKLSRELEVSKKELDSLARAWANAETTTERSDIAKAMRKQQTEIRNLSKNRDILKDLLPEEDVRGFGKRVASQVTEAFRGVSGSLGPVVATVLAASAPAIGATISGAIIGGAGLGGVVGGFLLAAQDTRVQTAFAGMKARILNELKDASTPFVDTTISGIGRIERAVDSIDFEQIFADSAKNAEPVIEGVATAVGDLGGAIEDLIHNSGPAVREIGKEIGALGSAVAGGLDSLSDNSKEGADALSNLFLIINLGVSSVFGLVNGLTEIYGFLRKISGGGLIDTIRGIADAHASVADKATSVAQAFIKSSDSIDQFGQSILTDGDAIATYSQQIEGLASIGQELFNSTTQVGAAIDNVTAAAKKNGKTLDENTVKGRANRDALSGLASSLIAQYQGYVAVNGEGRAANQVAADNRAQFVKLARQFGLTKTQASNLATELGLIPAKKSTSFTANTHDAAGRIEALKEQIASVHGKSVDVIVRASVSRKVENTLARFGGTFDATDYFAAAGAGDGIRRSGGASPVQVDNTTNVTVLLDGQEIRAVARSEAVAVVDRANHRQKVGKR